MTENWPIRLFRKSVLKKTKYQHIIEVLGPTDGKSVLEIGSDNGVYSYLFRQRGGHWKSADLDERSVEAIRSLVKTDVFRLVEGQPMPFDDDEFDIVILVDIIEHLDDDATFMRDVQRVLKPAGLLIINAPNDKSQSLLNRFRQRIGLTEAAHGHVRAGYTYEQLQRLLGEQFTLEGYRTHTKFFSKLMDTLMVLVISGLKRRRPEVTSGRGVLVTGADLASHRRMFALYAIVYPFVWLLSSLDHLLFFRSGYMIIASGYCRKPARPRSGAAEGQSSQPTLMNEAGVQQR
jgi:SAM-dependent methyltransferase